MRKLFAGLGAAIIAAGALTSPVSAQELSAAGPAETVIAAAALPDLGSSSLELPGFGDFSADGITDQVAAAVRGAVPAELIPGFVYSIFPWLAQSNSPAPAPVATPVLRNCAPHVEPEVRPGYIILYCGDAHSTLGDITWHSWDLDGASGRARLGEKTCNPSCAVGGFNYRYVNFNLGGIEWHGNEPRFTEAYIEGRQYQID